MFVGVARIVIQIPAAQSLKDRRRVVKGLKDRMRAKLPVSIAEIGDLERHQVATLGIAVIGNDSARCSELLSHAASLAGAVRDALVADVATEIISFGDGGSGIRGGIEQVLDRGAGNVHGRRLMISDGRRGKRVAELIRAHLAELMRREIDDPRLAALVITTVDVTDDLMSARIGVRLLVGDDDAKNRAAALKSLARGAGRLRRLVAPRLELRRSPELRFHYDTGHDAERRVEELLGEIERDDKPKG